MGGLIEIDDIYFSYDEKPVLCGLSLNIAAGQFYGIIGPNGSGKSTLVDLMIRMLTPEKGRIRYRGKNLGEYSKKNLSTEMALVPQNFYINFPFTVLEVVMMGRYPYIHRFGSPSTDDNRIVRTIMDQTETLEFETRYITELSGGERQRVIFARALAQDAPVLLLDEATSNLDINHTLALLKLAAEGVEKLGKTVIAVMQDINLAAVFCDQLIFMNAGTVSDYGPVDEVLNPALLRTVFGVESKVDYDAYAGALQVSFRK